MTITEIQEKFKKNEFAITIHAFEEAVDDFLSLNEVVTAVCLNGKIIETYPEDFRCLIHCKSRKQHIHVVVDYHDVLRDFVLKSKLSRFTNPIPKSGPITVKAGNKP